MNLERRGMPYNIYLAFRVSFLSLLTTFSNIQHIYEIRRYLCVFNFIRILLQVIYSSIVEESNAFEMFVGLYITYFIITGYKFYGTCQIYF